MSVCCGATVTESPVCTPIGSTFSIEQTITTLSLWSRITSSSNSPQPSTDWSISTWPIGDAASPRATICANSSASRAMPPPRPPSVNAGRTIAGRPISRQRARRLGERGRDRARGTRSPGRVHRLAEQVAVLGAVDRLVVRADQLDAVALERAVLVQRLGEVERGLAAERRQQRVGPLVLDDLATGRAAGSSWCPSNWLFIVAGSSFEGLQLAHAA